MTRFRPKQDEVLPFPDEDPSGRGGGYVLKRYSKKQISGYERACARWAGMTVEEFRAHEERERRAYYEKRGMDVPDR